MPPTNPPSPQSPAPTLVAIGSPEFNRAVAAAMEAQRVHVVVDAPAPPQVAQAPVIVQRTSIDTTKAGPDDLTIRFKRFCTMANCGYQRGQEAGFTRSLAEQAVASGSAFLVHDPRLHDPRYRRAA